MANTFVGSVMAIVSVAPARLSGTIWYFCAVSVGMSLMIAGIDLELREVDGRHAVLLGEQRGDLLVLDEPELDEVEPELAPVGLLIAQRLLQLGRRNALFLEQQLTNADGHRSGSLALWERLRLGKNSMVHRLTFFVQQKMSGWNPENGASAVKRVGQ